MPPSETSSRRSLARSSSPIPTISKPAWCERTNRTTACMLIERRPAGIFSVASVPTASCTFAAQQSAFEAQDADRRRIFPARRRDHRRDVARQPNPAIAAVPHDVAVRGWGQAERAPAPSHPGPIAAGSPESTRGSSFISACAAAVRISSGYAQPNVLRASTKLPEMPGNAHRAHPAKRFDRLHAQILRAPPAGFLLPRVAEVSRRCRRLHTYRFHRAPAAKTIGSSSSIELASRAPRSGAPAIESWRTTAS